MPLEQIIIANWKLERSFEQARQWVITHYNELSELSNKIQLVICPDVITMASLGQWLQGTQVLLGSQDCSPYLSGKHTGSISAQSLNETGCSYALIGHSEQRALSTLTPSDYASACVAALQQGISPILCIGEPAAHRFDRQAIKDLFTINLEALGRHYQSPIIVQGSPTVYIAYEPLWAVGSGERADVHEIAERVDWLIAILHSYDLSPRVGVLYGGSITSENSALLREIPYLTGLLLGASSLDMQSLKKIVYSFIK